MTTPEASLRVSAATLNRLLLPDPLDGRPLLALEHKATLHASSAVLVRAQPFGGAVRIRDQAALRRRVGDFRFDSPRSEEEQDLRVIIRPDQWPALLRVCLEAFEAADLFEEGEPAGDIPRAGNVRPGTGCILDGEPARELVEEFWDVLRVILRSEQVVYRPVGVVVAGRPAPTDSGRSPGSPTARIYRIFETRVIDPALGQALLASSRELDEAGLRDMARLDARQGGKGYANAALVLPLEAVSRHYLALPLAGRAAQTLLTGHTLESSVAAVLEGVDLPGAKRIQFPAP